MTCLSESELAESELYQLIRACVSAAISFQQYDAALPGLSSIAEALLNRLPDKATRAIQQQSQDTQTQETPHKFNIAQIAQLGLHIVDLNAKKKKGAPEAQSRGRLVANTDAQWLQYVFQAIQTLNRLAESQQWSEAERKSVIRACVADEALLNWHARHGWNSVAAPEEPQSRDSLVRMQVLNHVVHIMLEAAGDHAFAHGAAAYLVVHGLNQTLGLETAERTKGCVDSQTHNMMERLLQLAESRFAAWHAPKAGDEQVPAALQWLFDSLKLAESKLDAADLQAQIELLKVAIAFLGPGQTPESCMQILNEVGDSGADERQLIAVGDFAQQLGSGEFATVAFKSYRRALQASMRGNDTQPDVRGQIFVGLVQTCVNDLSTQIHWFEQALQLDESSFSTDSLSTLASVAWNTGRARYQLGQYSTAKRMLQMGLRFARRGTGFKAEHIAALQQQLEGLDQLVDRTQQASTGEHASVLGLEDLASSSEQLPELKVELHPSDQTALQELKDAGIFKSESPRLRSQDGARGVSDAPAASVQEHPPDSDEAPKVRARTPSSLQAPTRPPTAFRAIMAAEDSVSAVSSTQAAPSIGGSKRCRDESTPVPLVSTNTTCGQMEQPTKRQAPASGTVGDPVLPASSSAAADALMTLAHQADEKGVSHADTHQASTAPHETSSAGDSSLGSSVGEPLRESLAVVPRSSAPAKEARER